MSLSYFWAGSHGPGYLDFFFDLFAIAILLNLLFLIGFATFVSKASKFFKCGLEERAQCVGRARTPNPQHSQEPFADAKAFAGKNVTSSTFPNLWNRYFKFLTFSYKKPIISSGFNLRSCLNFS